MSLAIVHTRTAAGIKAKPVTVEVHISRGLPGFAIVGLPETAVKESRDRVRSAILNSRFEFTDKRITVNLAPADLPKEGGRFDLAIAIGILAASRQIKASNLDEYEFAAELALSGKLRPFRGALPFAMATSRAGRSLILSQDNADEAALCEELSVYPAHSLLQVCDHLSSDDKKLTPHRLADSNNITISYPDLSDVMGHMQAKRALEIAAAGGHNLLMKGPPGCGKTMLATRLPGLLPPLQTEEALEVVTLQSLSHDKYNLNKGCQRPFRAPHHSASDRALVGGGSTPKPGEISLAHHGILFLDELPEFNRKVLESLREPLESGKITISRAAHQAEFPAKFQLIAAMNPCPCGHHGNPYTDCHCTPDQIKRYTNRLSGPLLDRIDMHITVPAISNQQRKEFRQQARESSEVVRERVIRCRELQLERSGVINANLQGELFHQVCQLCETVQTVFDHAIDKLNLSMRAINRILKVARTIADLECSKQIGMEHVTEALQYRQSL